jgi:tetratricopeptide (TPR) repeat protein
MTRRKQPSLTARRPAECPSPSGRRRLLVLVCAAVAVSAAGGVVFVRRWSSAREHQAALEACERRDFAQARTLIEKCLQRSPQDASLHLTAARIIRRSALDSPDEVAWHEEALRHLDNSERLSGDRASLAMERNLLAAQQSPTASLERDLLELVQHGGADLPPILEALAAGYRKTHRFSRALDCLDKLLEVQPANAGAYYWRGLALEQVSQPRRALVDYEKTIDLDTEHLDARLHLANILLDFRRSEDAQVHFELLRQRQPGNVAVLLGLALCLHAQNQLPAAQELLEAALAIEPDNVKALTELGKIELEMGALADAERSLRHAVNLAPRRSHAIFVLYQCLQQEGKESEAVECLAQYRQIETDLLRLKKLQAEIKASPQSVDLNYEAGVLCLKYGMSEQGLRLLENVLRKDPSHRDARRALADYHPSRKK